MKGKAHRNAQQGPGREDMIRRTAPLVALTLASLLLSLLVAEGAFRALGYQPRRLELNPNFWITGWAAMDPELGWVNREGSFRSVEAGNAIMRFTADGRRLDPVGAKDTPKIVVVGCSYTQGEGVADDEPYPHVINRALPNLEVLNFGTGGYGTYQSLLRMQSYFRAPHAPTPLVIYGFNGHHMIRNVARSDWVFMLTTQDGRNLVPPHVALTHGRLTERPSQPVALWPLETRSALVADVHKAAIETARSGNYADLVEVFHPLMRQMADTVRANNAALLVVGLVSVPDDQAAWMRQAGFDYVDCQSPDFLTPAFRVGGWGHPNSRMHAHWGRCVLKALAERGIAVAAGEAAAPPSAVVPAKAGTHNP
jgi:hypothetical protein